MSRIFKTISEWKNLLLSILIIIILNLILTFVFGSYIRSHVQFVFGNNNKETFAALLFLEGAGIIGVGAWIASGYSEMVVIQKANPAATGYMAEKLSSQREEYRKRQISDGVILMLVGGALLATAYLIHLTL